MNETPPTQSKPPGQDNSPSPGLSDERLMLAFTQGCSEAFTELFHRYKQPIYGFFCRRVSNPASAEELTQETFFALLRAADRYEPRALFRTYLYAIGFKILRAHRRKAAFRGTLFGHRNSSTDPGIQDATEAGLWVRRAVQKLDPLDREIVMLREFEQLSYAEIADLLQLPLNTVPLPPLPRPHRPAQSAGTTATGTEGKPMIAATHEFLPEEVMAFLDGELSPERAAALSRHLETCAECSGVVTAQRELSQRMISWQVGSPSGRLTERVAASAQADGAKGELPARWVPERRRSPAFKWAIGIASGFAALVVLMAISTPNLLRSRMAGNESSAVGSLRVLNTAAITYLDSYGHYPPSLRSLGPPISGKPSEEGANLVDAVLAGGRKSGYLFTYRSYPPFGASRAGTYTIQADPLNPSHGIRHFSTDQSGLLFADGVELGRDLFAERASPDATKLLDAAELPAEAAPMIARSAVLRLVVKDMTDARERLNQILIQHGGYIAQLSAVGEGNSQQTLVASLRVPVNQLNDCIAEMKKLGRVVEETLAGEEVTSQHRDLVARLNNARTTESKLNDVIRQHTGKVADVLEVEKESARVRGEIEQMEAEQKTLEHRVNFATIDLKLAEEYKAQLNAPVPSVLMQLRNATINGFRNAFESLLALVLFLAESGPSLLLWLTLLGVPAWRLWRRYRRAQALGSLVGA